MRPAVPVTPRSNRPAAERPLSLGPASRLLGVDPDTLRRWADEGRIDAFTTAGGHRRFHRATVERILEARRHDATLRLATLGATTDRLSRAYRRGYSHGAPGGEVRDAIPSADRDSFRDSGRRLVAALLEHLDAADDAGRDGAEHEAIAVTDDLTRQLVASGIGPADAVSLFVASRRPFLAELGAIARRRSLDPERLIAIYDSSSTLLDRLLIRLVSSYPVDPPSAGPAISFEPDPAPIRRPA
jgi:excisionase family DNA binding protein